ncbi:MAG: AsmA family protein [Pseudomonadota bacterium]
MKRLLAVVAAVAVLAGLALFPAFLPADTVRKLALSRLEAVTGLSASVNGETQTRFLPSPAVFLDEVRLSDPESGQELVRIRQIIGRYSPVTLLFGRGQLSALTFVAPRIVWTLPEPDEPEAVTADVPDGLLPGLIARVFGTEMPPVTPNDKPIRFGRINVIDGDLLLNQADGSQAYRVDDFQFGIEQEDSDPAATVTASFVWNERAVDVRSIIADPTAILAQERTGLSFNAASVTGNFSFEGALSFAAGPQLDGALKIESNAFDDALEWFGIRTREAPGFDRLSVDADASLAGRSLKLSDLDLAVDGNTASGIMNLSVVEDRVAVDGTLAFDRLSIDDYLEADEAGDGLEQETPLPQFDPPRNLTMDIRLSANEVQGAGFQVQDIAASLVVKDRRIDIGIGTADFMGGNMAGSISARPIGDVLRVETDLSLRDVPMNRLVPLSEPFGIEGQANATLMLEGAAKTVESLRRAMYGQSKFEVRDGQVTGIDVPAMVTALRSQSLEGFRTGANAATPFTALVIDVETIRGVARTRTLNMFGDNFELTGDGQVDLVAETIDGTGQIDVYPDGRPTEPVAPANGEGEATETPEPLSIGFRINGPLIAPAILPLIPLLKQGAADDAQRAAASSGG